MAIRTLNGKFVFYFLKIRADSLLFGKSFQNIIFCPLEAVNMAVVCFLLYTNVCNCDDVVHQSRDNDPEAWTQYFGYLGGEVHHNNQCGDNSYNTGGTRLASWRLQSNVKWATLRFGSCYAGGNSQGTTMYAFPKITELLVT